MNRLLKFVKGIFTSKIKWTYWACPKCKHEFAIDAYELAEIGTPHCWECEEQEMVPANYQKITTLSTKKD